MDETVHFGRIAGVGVGANWSVLVIFWLIAWGLAVNVLPDAAPGQATPVYWVVGVAAAIVFLACLLAHEVAHAVLARRAGVGVEGITLWMFGGVSRLESDAPTARDELRIAVVGPATSAALGAVIGLLALILAVAGAPEVLIHAAIWLAWINVLLAGFNLLPAFPLDGGRVLRGLIWRRTGDPVRAVVTASTTGRVFGYALIGLGIVAATGGAGLGGVWFVLLGWIILMGARAERAAFEVHHLLKDVTVGDVMSHDPVTAPEGISVGELVHDYVLPHHWSAYPLVGTGGRTAGLVTLRQIRHVPERERATTPVTAVATPIAEVPTAAPGEPVVDLLERMQARRGGGRRALVLDDGALVGLVSISDIERALEVAESDALSRK